MNCDRYPPGVHYRDINLYRQRLQQKLASQPYTGGLRFNFVDVFESSPTASSVGGHNDQSGSDSTLDNRDSVSSLNSSQHAELVQQQSRTPSALSLANVDTDYTTSTTNTGHITDNNRDLSNSTQKAADDDDNKDQVDLHSIHQPNSSITSPWVELDINQGVVEENQEVQTQEQIEDKGNASKPATSSDDDKSALNAEQSVESSEYPSSRHECSEFGTFPATESTTSTCSAHSSRSTTSHHSVNSNRFTKTNPSRSNKRQNHGNTHQARTSVDDSDLKSFMTGMASKRQDAISTRSTTTTNNVATVTADETSQSPSIHKIEENRDIIFESAAQPEEQPQMNTAPSAIQPQTQTHNLNLLASSAMHSSATASFSDYILISTLSCQATTMNQQQHQTPRIAQSIPNQPPINEAGEHHNIPHISQHSFDPLSMASGELIGSSVFHDSAGNPRLQTPLDYDHPSMKLQAGYYPPDRSIFMFISNQSDQLPDLTSSPPPQQPGGAAAQPLGADANRDKNNIYHADNEEGFDDNDESDECVHDDLFGSATGSLFPT